ncbi:MAG: acetyl-CoA carboxylase, carboxyltransferase subunit beta [bacterium]|nr:acetyl-CoA carboxylase, carboxyltransferase subunit beta [bacterium]
MASWFSRVRAPKPSSGESDRVQVPDGLWTKCGGCSSMLYTKELVKNLKVCPKCGYHFRLSLEERIQVLTDGSSFEEFDTQLKATDPLNFRDSLKYRDRLKKAIKVTGEQDAVKIGKARIDGQPVMLGLMNFSFMGGSMGMVVGEKLTRMIERAIAEKLPVIIVSASGGARMQEGIFSLMQMAKISAALSRLAAQRLPYISLMSDPTTGGVAASFAMQGDVHITEPGTLIGFAGPRVIEQTIRKKLPEGFQRAEFLLEHGMVDMVVPRNELKTKIGTLLSLLDRSRLDRGLSTRSGTSSVVNGSAANRVSSGVVGTHGNA